MTKLIAGLVILGAAGLIIFTTGDRKVDRATTEESASDQGTDLNQEEQKDFNEKTTLAVLMKKGGNYMCTFEHATEVGNSMGTVYIAGKEMRGDFKTSVTMQGVPAGMGDIESHMISDGESIHTWSSMSSEGYTMLVNQEAETNTSSEIPTNQELDYACVTWDVDASKFRLPTHITFKTL